MALLAEKYSCKTEWKYFATSHGKGVVDRICGAVKSLVRRKVMSKGSDATVVQNSTHCFKVAKSCMK